MIAGQITEQDFVAAHRLACRKSGSIITGILLAIFLGGLIWFFVQSWETGVRIMVTACFAFVAHLVQYRIYVPWKARRLFAQIRHKTQASYSWDMDTLTWSDPQSHAVNPWNSFIRARENGQVMIPYFNDALYLIVPKQWFGNTEDLAAFRSHLNFSY